MDLKLPTYHDNHRLAVFSSTSRSESTYEMRHSIINLVISTHSCNNLVTYIYAEAHSLHFSFLWRSQESGVISTVKPHPIPRLKSFSLRLSVVLAQSTEARCLSLVWRCSGSSTDRRCSNYIWVINNFIAHKGASYIRGLMVMLVHKQIN